MNNVLIEAVPNFSEGQRLWVVDALAAAIQVPGVRLLNRTSDADHNRSVLTVAGPPEAVVEGLFQAVRVAAAEINLFEHKGAHPRLGAADVVPIVPIQQISLEACAALATDLGRRIGEELNLPVFLYEASATRQERQNLANLRHSRFQFEELRQAIQEPEHRPDFGPAQMGSAGAVVVGARPFLIAFNIFLKSSDVGIAKSIAHKIRERNGGLPAVKALGLLVDGEAQVSMNLTDFRRTSLPVVMELVSALAKEQGVEVARGELIGLLPQDALVDVAAHYLKIPDLHASHILEHMIRST